MVWLLVMMSGPVAIAAPAAGEPGKAKPERPWNPIGFRARLSYISSEELNWSRGFEASLMPEAPSWVQLTGGAVGLEGFWLSPARSTHRGDLRYMLGAELSFSDLRGKERWSGPGYRSEGLEFVGSRVALLGTASMILGSRGVGTLDAQLAHGVGWMGADYEYTLDDGSSAANYSGRASGVVVLHKVSFGLGAILNRNQDRRPSAWATNPGVRLDVELIFGSNLGLFLKDGRRRLGHVDNNQLAIGFSAAVFLS